MHKKVRAIGAGILAAVWLCLAVLAWFKPAEEYNYQERRKMSQFPEYSQQALNDGEFMAQFADYAVDQFPLRVPLRMAKALFHSYVLQHKDNNGIYIADGYAVQMEYPLNKDSVDHALSQFEKIYDLQLKDSNCNVYVAVVPDKGYYLAEENGYLAMDYTELFAMVQEKMPWAEYVDLTDCLQAEDYYRTDTHWRQERILPAAQKLCGSMGVTAPKLKDYKVTALDRPFYGVHYGHAALPMDPETMYILESDLLKDCQVYVNNQLSSGIYDMEKLEGPDMYEVFLSGRQGVVRIENPNATTQRELVVFRDSYGSSLVPLLVQDYAVVTMIDNRDIVPARVKAFVEFTNQDVLFLHSSLVLNTDQI